MTHHGPQLITYADRLAGDLRGLRGPARRPARRCVRRRARAAVLHAVRRRRRRLRPAATTRRSTRASAPGTTCARSRAGRTVMADVIVNHVSADSAQFLDVRERGDASPCAPMFLTLDAVFPDGATEADLARIYRPRPGLPFTVDDPRRASAGSCGPRSPPTRSTSTCAPRRRGTTSTDGRRRPDVRRGAHAAPRRRRVHRQGGGHRLLHDARDRRVHRADRRSARTRAARRCWSRSTGTTRSRSRSPGKVDLVYDFALPPLVLHALTAGDLAPLDRVARDPTRERRHGARHARRHRRSSTSGRGPRPGEPGLLAPDADRRARRGDPRQQPAARRGWRPARPRRTSTSTRSTAPSTTRSAATTAATCSRG